MNATPAFRESEAHRSAGDVDASSVLSAEHPARQEPMRAHLSLERASRMGRSPDAGVFSKNPTPGSRSPRTPIRVGAVDVARGIPPSRDVSPPVSSATDSWRGAFLSGLLARRQGDGEALAQEQAGPMHATLRVGDAEA